MQYFNAQAQLWEGDPSNFDTMYLHILWGSSLDAAWNLNVWLDRGYAPSCDVRDTMVSIYHDVDNFVHKLFSFVIDE